MCLKKVRVHGKNLFGVHPIAFRPHSEERLGEEASCNQKHKRQ
jgi:hypothetical protein